MRSVTSPAPNRTQNACLAADWEHQVLRRDAPRIETKKEVIRREMHADPSPEFSEWALRVLLRYINPPVRTSHLPARSETSYGCGACWCFRKQLSSVIWSQLDRVPAFCSCIQLCRDHTHCRATVPPIGSSTATPQSAHACCVRAASLHTIMIHHSVGDTNASFPS